MAEQTNGEGGFEFKYETGTNVQVSGSATGFVVLEHSELDKPLKIHATAIPDLAERADEESSAHFLF